MEIEALFIRAMSDGCHQRVAGQSLALAISPPSGLILTVGFEINADVLPVFPNHVRARWQRIGCKCPIAEDKRDREHNPQHDSRQHRFHWKAPRYVRLIFLEKSMLKCVLGAVSLVTGAI